MKHQGLWVGAFVLVAAALIVAAVLWLSGSSLFNTQLRAVIYFEGSVSGLYVGAPVTFRGVNVGQVDAIGIEVDARTLAARIPVRVRLQPDRLRFDNGAPSALPDLPQLVKRGLRARLVAQSFVTGQKFIDLDFVPDSPATLVSGGRELEIPALADRFGALIDQVAELPLRQTVQELRDTLKSLQLTLDSTRDALGATARELSQTATEARTTLAVASGALQKVQGHAEATLSSITRLSETTQKVVLGTQPELQRTLASAREAAESASLAMRRVAELTAPGAGIRADLDSAVRDLSQAARSFREWSEILEQQPNAVIFGSERR